MSRAAALGDYDNDGDVDVFVANLNAPPNLLRNEEGNRNTWLGLDLVGTASNRDAIGARVRVEAGGLIQVREVHRGYGFQAQHDPRLLFGLGQIQQVDRVEIRWPSGRLQMIEEVPLRRYLKIQEGSRQVVAGARVLEPDAAGVDLASSKRKAAVAESIPPIGQPHWRTGDYTRAGREFYRQGRYGEARAAFEQAIRLEPDSLQVYANLAVVLFAGMGRDEEAIPLLKHILERDPDRVSIHFLLGKIYLNLNRLPEAIDALQTTARLSPQSWEAYSWLGLAYMRAASLEEAAAALQKASRGAPWRPVPHQRLARVYENLGQKQAARRERDIFARLYPLQLEVDHYRDLVEVDPRDAEVHSALGKAYATQGRLVEAIQEWRQVLHLLPNHPQAANWIRRARGNLARPPQGSNSDPR